MILLYLVRDHCLERATLNHKVLTVDLLYYAINNLALKRLKDESLETNLVDHLTSGVLNSSVRSLVRVNPMLKKI